MTEGTSLYLAQGSGSVWVLSKLYSSHLLHKETILYQFHKVCGISVSISRHKYNNTASKKKLNAICYRLEGMKKIHWRSSHHAVTHMRN